MQDAEVGWIAAIIIGGLASWLAEMFMKSGTGILTNIVLGIVGAAVANFLLGLFGVTLGGWLGYLIAGVIGACVLIFAWRAIKGRTRSAPRKLGSKKTTPKASRSNMRFWNEPHRRGRPQATRAARKPSA